MRRGKPIASMVIEEDEDGPFTILTLADSEPEVMDVPPHMVQQLPMMIAMMKRQLGS